LLAHIQHMSLPAVVGARGLNRQKRLRIPFQRTGRLHREVFTARQDTHLPTSSGFERQSTSRHGGAAESGATECTALRAQSARLHPWHVRARAASPAHGCALTRGDERARAGIQVAMAVARLQVQVGGRPARRRARRRHRRPLRRLAPLHRRAAGTSNGAITVRLSAPCFGRNTRYVSGTPSNSGGWARAPPERAGKPAQARARPARRARTRRWGAGP